MIRIIFALMLLCGDLSAAQIPNPSLTPGLANPALTKEVICSPSFRTKPYRHVTQSMHKAVWTAYGKDWNKDHACCEDDHLISLELGGSNDNKNRWPQPWPEARIKDHLENILHKKVCDGEISLSDAQHAISTEWAGEYRKIIGPLP